MPPNKLLLRRGGENCDGDQQTAEQKGHCGNTIISRKLYVPNLSSGEERGRPKTSCKPEGSELLHKDRALQNGRDSHPPRFDSTPGLDGEIRLKDAYL